MQLSFSMLGKIQPRPQQNATSGEEVWQSETKKNQE